MEGPPRRREAPGVGPRAAQDARSCWRWQHLGALLSALAALNNAPNHPFRLLFGRDGLSDAHAHSDREGGAWRRLFLLLGRLQRVNAQSRGAAKPMENSSTVSTVRPAGQLTTHDDQRRFVMRIIPRQLALFGHYRIVRTILQCNGSG